MKNNEVTKDFVKYLNQRVIVKIALPNVFEITDVYKTKHIKKKILKALDKFLDYSNNDWHVDIETAYKIPLTGKKLNICFTLSKHQYDRLKFIADKYRMSIAEAVLVIVSIADNAFDILNGDKSGMLNKSGTKAQIEAKLKTKSSLKKDETPWWTMFLKIFI